MICKYLFLTFILHIDLYDASQMVQVDRPRGVSLTKKVLYDPAKEFTCFDGSQTIQFQFVNDDYCDCNDGSDEPGTSACPNGSFHCTNAGYRPQNIPSSRVNDGICDCCDGTDEWKTPTACANTCMELRRAALEENKKKMEESSKGFALRQEYAKTGQAKKLERQEKVKELQQELAQIQLLEDTLKTEKEAIEIQETAAIDEHKRIAEEKQQKIAHEENLRKGAEAFSEMDVDKDGSLTIPELLSHPELDPDTSDGIFTEEEALTILQAGSVDMAVFMDTVWGAINETFRTNIPPPMEEQETPAEDQIQDGSEQEREADRELLEEPEEEDQDQDEEDEDSDEEYDDEHEYDEDGEYREPPVLRKETDTSNSGEPYDEITQNLVNQANEARSKFQEAQTKKKNLENEVESLNKALELDFGPDEGYQALQFQCFELLTMEYKYKLCPYDKATQSPKNGGSETVLGRWGSWSGPPENIYAKMMYENGITCWNGPARSTEVVIRCGMEHKLLSVDEPSRCAYKYEFATPCACTQVDPNALPRDEL
uniref:Glucosidase 2 subunit beta n=1 Tax=Phallusia mammillata TaxID=59560 RepID=A0A6F9DP06_9ASCI|nr:glucosidase 2 subunit beta [Phallusia mammillata]